MIPRLLEPVCFSDKFLVTTKRETNLQPFGISTSYVLRIPARTRLPIAADNACSRVSRSSLPWGLLPNGLPA